MKTNDILVKGTEKRKVLFVKGDSVVVSRIGYFDEMAKVLFTQKELLYDGWTLEAKPWVPEVNENYFTPAFGKECLYMEYTNYDFEYDNTIISRGLAFKTKEDAISKAKVMLGE